MLKVWEGFVEKYDGLNNREANQLYSYWEDCLEDCAECKELGYMCEKCEDELLEEVSSSRDRW